MSVIARYGFNIGMSTAPSAIKYIKFSRNGEANSLTAAHPHSYIMFHLAQPFAIAIPLHTADRLLR